MKPPKIIGRLAYFFGYPLFRLLIRNTHRTYMVIVYNNRMLVTKNWLGFQKKWRLPGGGVQADETAYMAVQREIVEELGVSINESKLQQLTTEPLRSQYGYRYDLFLYTIDQVPAMRIDNREILVADFIGKNDLKQQDISEEVQQAIRLIGW